MDYRSYLFSQQFKHYNDEVARHGARISKLLEAQLKSQMFYKSDSLTILISLRLPNGVWHEWYSQRCGHKVTPLFINKAGGEALRARTCLTSSRWSWEAEKLTPHYQLANYLLTTFTSNDIISDGHADLFHYTQPQNLNTVDYLKLLRQSPFVVCMYMTSND